jgi:RNA polymerase sigma factor (TIGR02999 family)
MDKRGHRDMAEAGFVCQSWTGVRTLPAGRTVLAVGSHGFMESSPSDVTLLLKRLSQGDKAVLHQLMPVVYGELRRLASSYMRRERPDHTLQTTALVHEAYLQLVGQERAHWENRGQFFGVAAQLMRRILVDHARAHAAAKRGGASPNLSLDEAMVMAKERGSDLLVIEELLTRLATIDPQQVRVVEMRFFAGLSVEETAQALAISDRTVKRDWAMAKAWMLRELTRRVQDDPSASSDERTA